MVMLIAFLAVGVGIVSGEKPVSTAGQAAEFRLAADDPTDAAEFGRSVAMDGNLVAVGAGGADANSVSNAGAVYLFKRQGQGYAPEAKLVAPDATDGAEFGRAVAIQGNTVIVGARFAQVGDLAKAGAVYVFKKYQGSWHFEDKIVSPEPADEDNFGRALAVQGNLLVVTARKENLNAADVGAAYVFTCRGGEWTNTAKITAGDPAPGAYFGQSVAVQGGLIVVGARNADPDGAGAIYLFRESPGGWNEIAKVAPPDGKADDNFGFTVAMAGDTITVGARRADLPGAKDAGAAYVFSLHGNSVDLVTELTAGDARAGDQLGQAIALAGDVIAVGANRADTEDGADTGAIYLFRRMSNQWTEVRKVTASDGVADDEFGYSLSAFGNRMVTGAHTADSTAGAAYVTPLKP
ncbi:MAG: FG-GAP repeat protein [Methanoculleus sp.]|nr:FG-GAP repeat protein [Methanoculleus sp.]